MVIGLTDSEIRTRLLKEREVRSFSEKVNIATAIKFSKKESAMISEPFKGMRQIK